MALDSHLHEHAGEGSHVHHSEMDAEARAGLLVQAARLEWFSLAWNLLETGVGLAAGIVASSVALVGFGLDSVVESSSAAILVWRLYSERRGRSTESSERASVRAVAVAFFVLAAYVGIRSVADLASGTHPEESTVGIVLAAVSLIVMPWLAARKRAMARRLDSKALQADSAQTSLCTLLSAFLLVGLATNALFGWWWADPVAGVAIAVIAAREGRELWTTEDFCIC